MKMVPLGEVAVEVKPGFACGTKDERGIFQLRMHNVSGESDLDLSSRRRVPANAHRTIDRYFVRAGDVMFNVTNSPERVGKSVLISALDEPLVFSNHFVRLRFDESTAQPQYVQKWLRWRYLSGRLAPLARQWVNQATIATDRLLEQQIPLPPLDEQRRIAAILDHADALRAKRHQQLDLLKLAIEACFVEMFGDLQPTATGEAIARSTRTGPFGSQLLHSEFVDDGVAVLGLDNVVGNEFRWAAPRFITEQKYADLARYTVEAGDVLISIMGTVGRCVVVPTGIPTAINTKHICAVRVDPDVMLPEVLRAMFLWHPAPRAYLRRQTKGAIMAGLNMGIIRAMPLPVPAIAAQREFLARSRALDALSLQARSASDAADALFASLQHRAFQ